MIFYLTVPCHACPTVQDSILDLFVLCSLKSTGEAVHVHAIPDHMKLIIITIVSVSQWQEGVWWMQDYVIVIVLVVLCVCKEVYLCPSCDKKLSCGY